MERISQQERDPSALIHIRAAGLQVLVITPTDNFTAAVHRQVLSLQLSPESDHSGARTQRRSSKAPAQKSRLHALPGCVAARAPEVECVPVHDSPHCCRHRKESACHREAGSLCSTSSDSWLNVQGSIKSCSMTMKMLLANASTSKPSGRLQAVHESANCCAALSEPGTAEEDQSPSSAVLIS